jgi:hypothetical protein
MRKPSSTLLFAALLGLVLPSCEMYTHNGPFPAYSKNTLVPQTFLYSEYKPLNAWLDTPVRVLIQDVPLLEVFKHPTLRGINFQVIKAPRNNPLINIDSLALTRRQLLWTLCHDHELKMTANFHPDGGPSSVDVRSIRLEPLRMAKTAEVTTYEPVP